MSLQDICDRIASGEIKNIVVLTGAGVSTSAGIPDFRSEKTGLYANLQRFELKQPEDIFSIDYFREKPEAFYTLSKELFPDGRYRPTAAHYFIKLLQQRGCLLRNVTQQIDGLEMLTGLKQDEHVIQAHGCFDRAACIDCMKPFFPQDLHTAIFSDRVPRCQQCGGLVKPTIVFFGESLPSSFERAAQEDLPKADLLIVMGSSLRVQPFAGLIDRVSPFTSRILINRERTGELYPSLVKNEAYQEWRERLNYLPAGSPMRDRIQNELRAMRKKIGGFVFDDDENTRDVFLEGDCDEGVRKLAAMIGPTWAQELETLIQNDGVPAKQ